MTLPLTAPWRPLGDFPAVFAADVGGLGFRVRPNGRQGGGWVGLVEISVDGGGTWQAYAEVVTTPPPAPVYQRRTAWRAGEVPDRGDWSEADFLGVNGQASMSDLIEPGVPDEELHAIAFAIPADQHELTEIVDYGNEQRGFYFNFLGTWYSSGRPVPRLVIDGVESFLYAPLRSVQYFEDGVFRLGAAALMPSGIQVADFLQYPA